MSLRRLRPEEPQVPQEAPPSPPTAGEVVEQTNQEYAQIQKELKEIGILIGQSALEVEKLAQRNAQLTNKVRTAEDNIDTMPRQDIKEIYTAAQEAQMRLFMMRGQVEQLQNRQDNLKRYGESLRRILDISGSLMVSAGEAGGSVKRDGEGSLSSESSGIIRIINAQEGERQNLSIRLHDGPAQSLTNLILQAEICERLFDSDPVRARTELSELKQAVTGTFQKVREFIFDLRPMMLDDLGLTPTLKKSIEDYEQKTGIACNLTVTGKDRRLPSHTEVTVFRVVQQLLTNVREHARASHIQMSMDVGDERISVSVEDDGTGFEADQAMTASLQRKTMGLSTMRERTHMLEGEFHIDSAIGRGTRIDFWLPIN